MEPGRHEYKWDTIDYGGGSIDALMPHDHQYDPNVIHS